MLKERILSVFFAAMQDGYANDGNARKSTVVKFHGLKMVLFNSGDFKVQDSWLVAPNSSHSSGQTLILEKDDPVWVMSYQGRYDEIAIPFLKQALRETYGRSEFIGGRGPRSFVRDGMTYINDVELGNWDHFRGHEKVLDGRGRLLGWHEYQGLLLVD